MLHEEIILQSTLSVCSRICFYNIKDFYIQTELSMNVNTGTSDDALVLHSPTATKYTVRNICTAGTGISLANSHSIHVKSIWARAAAKQKTQVEMSSASPTYIYKLTRLNKL